MYTHLLRDSQRAYWPIYACLGFVNSVRAHSHVHAYLNQSFKFQQWYIICREKAAHIPFLFHFTMCVRILQTYIYYTYMYAGDVWRTCYRWFWQKSTEDLHGWVHGRLYFRHVSTVPFLSKQWSGLLHSRKWWVRAHLVHNTRDTYIVMHTVSVWCFLTRDHQNSR